MEWTFRWFKRIAATCAITGGIVYVGWKGLHMISSDKSRVFDHHDSRKQDHYVRIQMNCSTAARNLMSPLKEIIASCLSTESITLQLKNTNEQAVKVELWEKLKIISFSKAVVSACVCSILVILVRIQFSIIAAYLFSNEESITEDIQRQYFSILHQSLQQGLPSLVEHVKASAEVVLGQYSLKHTVTIENIKEIILQILDNSSSITSRQGGVSWLLSFTVQKELHSNSGNELNHLLMATQDVLEIQDTQLVIEELVERAIHQGTHVLTEAFHSAAQSSTSLPLAKVIPIISDNAVVLLHSQNRILEEMINKDELMTLSRNCYEAFSE